MLHKLKKHDLISTFVELKGNPKWAIMTEPLWFIPYALFSPFHSLYMAELGVSDWQIGFIISLGVMIQVVFALIGGILTDKMGRRNATLIFDTVAWTIPCFIWAFSQNFWWFLMAAIINATYQITNASWNCLFIEDCPPRLVTNAFTLIQICGMLSIFVAPLAVIWVGEHGVVHVVRIIYFISAISMFLKFILLYKFGGETEMGKQRMIETKNVSFWSLFAGYKLVFLKMIKSKRMMLVVVFMAISNVVLIATNNFFPLYITDELLLSNKLVAVFPVVRTIVMFAFVIGLQNVVNKFSMKHSIIIGLTLYIISHVLLIMSPQSSIMMVVFYTMFEAAAYAVVVPRRDALMALFVDAGERSRIYALYNTSMLAITVPFGVIIGYLSELNGMFPFIFNILLFIGAICLMIFTKELTDENLYGKTDK